MKLALLSVLLLGAVAARADGQGRAWADRTGGRIWRVDVGAAPLSHVDFLDLQPAVDAASDGDLILVAPGQYGSTTIEGKSVAIVADGGGTVTVAGLGVEGLDERQRVVVRGISAASPTVVEAGEGLVWIEGCELKRLFVRDTRSCVVVRSTLWGGLDARGNQGLFLYECGLYGANGGDGYACGCGFIFECNFLIHAGNGSPGVALEETTALLWGCDARGGRGGDGQFAASYCCAEAGDGGSGLVVRPGAIATVVATRLTGGRAGAHECYGSPGPHDGFPILYAGGQAAVLEGAARGYEASAAARLEGALTLSFDAFPDDRPTVLRSMAPLAQPGSSLGLPNLVALDSPSLTFDPLLTGSKEIEVAPFPIDGADFGAFFTQALYEVNAHGVGELVVGPPSVCVVLSDPCFAVPPAPDCNANGLADPCEIANALSRDVDGDGLPDECVTAWQVASGPMPVVGSAPIVFVVPAGPRPSGPVRLRVTSVGLRSSFAGHRFEVVLNDVPLVDLRGGAQASCQGVDAYTFVVEAGTFETIAGSEDLVVTLRPGSFTACSGASVSVELAYPRADVDCNGNLVPDAFDLSARTDCDGNSVLDRCELLRRAGGRTLPFNVYFPLDVTIPAPARSSRDVIVTIDSVSDSNGTLQVNSTYIGAPISRSCPNRRQRQVIVPRDRWNAIVGDGPALVRAQVSAPSSASCEDFGVMEVFWTDPAIDCNGNGRLDSCDIASGQSPDVNGNGIPDECEP